MNFFHELDRVTREYLSIMNIMETEMPIYKVTTTLPDDTHAMKAVTVVKLVEAANVNAAVRHASKAFISADVCSTSEAVTLGASGVKVERAQ